LKSSALFVGLKKGDEMLSWVELKMTGRCITEQENGLGANNNGRVAPGAAAFGPKTAGFESVGQKVRIQFCFQLACADGLGVNPIAGHVSATGDRLGPARAWRDV
jgi:hypothetical protein